MGGRESGEGGHDGTTLHTIHKTVCTELKHHMGYVVKARSGLTNSCHTLIGQMCQSAKQSYKQWYSHQFERTMGEGYIHVIHHILSKKFGIIGYH